NGPPPRELRGWLYAIARNAIVDHFRSQQARTRLHHRLDAPALEVDDDGVEQGGVDLTICVATWLDQLEPEFARALRLTDMGSMTQAEAAEAEGLSVSGMKSRVQRGRAKLRALIEACCTIEQDRRGTPVVAEAGEGCGCRADTTVAP